MFRRLFPSPALSRMQRIEGKPAVLLTSADMAYLEGFDAASAYPGEIADLLQGIADGLRNAEGEGQRKDS